MPQISPLPQQQLKKRTSLNSRIQNNDSSLHQTTRQQNQLQPQQHQHQQQQIGLIDQFRQQMLKAWQPVPTLTKTILLFFIMAIVFLGIGIPMIILSKGLNQSVYRYDQQCTINQLCTVTFQVKQELIAPVFVYYEIHNFYQNHRLYASSFSNDQLIGKEISVSTAQQSCQPIVYNNQLYVTTSFYNSSIILNPNDIAIPCGMIAYTIFNDSFTLSYSNNTQIFISNQNIAWPTDIQRYKLSQPEKTWLNITDERFMNWMRIAAMSDFRKLWGRIQNNVPAGNYTLKIQNNYDLSKINGEKYFVLSTSNFFGSKSNFLSITYIAVGSVCCLIGFLFLMRKLSKKRKNY